MMTTARRALLGLAALLLGGALQAATAADAGKWVEGRHYVVLRPAQASQAAPGKVEVTEVFSYGCPACFHFQPQMEKIKAALPANAQLVLVHASWGTAESWPLFQRAFITAQALGIAEKSHAAMFTAIWGERSARGRRSAVGACQVAGADDRGRREVLCQAGRCD